MEFYRNESFVCHIRYGFVGVAHFQIKNLTTLRRRHSLRLTGVTLDGPDATTQYVRSKFLKMYQTDAQYFWTNSSMAWWQSVSGQNFDDSSDLLVWLNSQTYDSTWLNFIKVQ